MKKTDRAFGFSESPDDLIEEPKHLKEDSSPFTWLGISHRTETSFVTLLQITLPKSPSHQPAALPGSGTTAAASGQPHGGRGPPTELCLRQALSRGLSPALGVPSELLQEQL